MLTESGYKYSFAQHADAKELFDRLNRNFPDAHFKSQPTKPASADSPPTMR